MITRWNDDGITYECSACGYIYHEYYDDRSRTTTHDKPFIELQELLFYKKQRDYVPDTIVRLHHYACPKCGVLQIDTHDL